MRPALAGALIPHVAAPPPPPTDPFYQEVALLLHFDSLLPGIPPLRVQDFSRNAKTITQANSMGIDTTNSVFGGGSTQNDGSVNAAQKFTTTSPITDAVPLIPGSGDFTFECWLYFTAADLADNSTFDCMFQSVGSAHSFYFARFPGAKQLYVQCPGGVFGDLGPTPTITALTANGWHFISWTRAAGVSYFHVDGALAATFTGDTNVYGNNNNAINIGPNLGGSVTQRMNLDDMRLTLGIARYTSAGYVVPSEPFPDS